MVYDPHSKMDIEVLRVLTSRADIDRVVDLRQPGQGIRTNKVLLGMAIDQEDAKNTGGFYAYYFPDVDEAYVDVLYADENGRFDPDRFLATPREFIPIETSMDEDSVKLLENRIGEVLIQELCGGNA